MLFSQKRHEGPPWLALQHAFRISKRLPCGSCGSTATGTVFITCNRWRGNIKETIAKGWWSLNTERTDRNTATEAESGENGSSAVNEELELPKLPIPLLERTMKLYLETLKPILDEKQHDSVRRLVSVFTNGPGPMLQELLIERREERDNWAYDWWLHDMYLCNQVCLPVNSNPGMVFPPLPNFSDETQMAKFSARFVVQMMNFKRILDKRALPVEKATSREKGQPLCMAQYYRLMTSYREPGLVKDRLINVESELTISRPHIIVACKSQFYVLRLTTGDDATPLSEEQIATKLLDIILDAKKSTDTTNTKYTVGILTSQKRDDWAHSRELLMKSASNRNNLTLIERSLFIINFDLESPGLEYNSDCKVGAKGYLLSNERDETNMIHQMMHGGGSEYCTGNRWFDKTIQLVIGQDGANGLCYEHSPSEGIAVIELMEKLIKSTKDLNEQVNNPIASTEKIEKLTWSVNNELIKHIADASSTIDRLVKNLDFHVFRFTQYGKEFIKSCNVSPDVYIQLAMQLAYHKLHGKLVATYESASTRRFRLGRVDCIRAATVEALEWAKAMNQSAVTESGILGTKKIYYTATENEKLQLFEKAVKKQTDIMVDNILGMGIDIHLLGLRQAAKENGLPCPLFEDDSYRIANNFALSTSQLLTTTDSFVGYGPVVPDGYGVSYNPKHSSLVFCISSFKSSRITNKNAFTAALEQSLVAMQKMMYKKNIET
ncbi:choline O-acetyltransferase [Daktulosphaira vitifoliae]|uniref:choline O-acetyltransferase n=1 Tax=Daktulosphaira vitifoliae TaxID=58002 RepID=UPI0021AA5D04|nr:choline O-acetyltransferase [Daktulosphaira vitifoliae]